MSELPVTTSSTDDVTQQSSPPVPSGTIVSSGGKEVEGSRGVGLPELPLKPVGQEVELPKEVSQAGVTVQPTTVPIPPQVAQQGVQAGSANVPVQPTDGSTVKLPLTNDQIEQGLHTSVASSIRWLAEWCVRQIKMMHGKIQKKK